MQSQRRSHHKKLLYKKRARRPPRLTRSVSRKRAPRRGGARGESGRGAPRRGGARGESGPGAPRLGGASGESGRGAPRHRRRRRAALARRPRALHQPRRDHLPATRANCVDSRKPRAPPPRNAATQLTRDTVELNETPAVRFVEQ